MGQYFCKKVVQAQILRHPSGDESIVSGEHHAVDVHRPELFDCLSGFFSYHIGQGYGPDKPILFQQEDDCLPLLRQPVHSIII